ncbi:alpha/beta fold hydrolase [Ramlibacter algicola]|uniref:Alpha/beta fold hydrolase n=1 Tax=Ramlibacter algicola TaxID=2795217 RepID=A0A934URJ8_9BURK|nr:alpha/beta fold hydrolase [Ramlibacter algicola]MBK0392768.1 alpha/beta fold hydrolase [Ramlibacter algicola]
MRVMRFLVALALLACALAARAADYPAPKDGTFVLKDFRFHTGQVLPEVRMHYLTIGDPKNEPVLLLHGTAGSARSMLTPAFAGELYGAGQPLDAGKYFLIIPDNLGHGQSTKPSDGMRASFPRYNYEDMVDAQYRLVKEGLGIKHLRLVMGNSMGGMHTWIWGSKYAGEMDALVPMACQPSEMSSRNWILRRLITDSITNDPEWNGGNYTRQPKSAQFASTFFAFATSGGDQSLYRQAPTREKADALLDARLKAPFPADANDVLYQWASSGDYNASPGLEKIQAQLLAINAADDERNPISTGIMDREMKRVKNGRYYLIPASDQTAGHGTTGSAKWYSKQLGEFLRGLPRRAD